MKDKRFTEERITYARHQAGGETPLVDVCRQRGVSEASFRLWKKDLMQFEDSIMDRVYPRLQ